MIHENDKQNARKHRKMNPEQQLQMGKAEGEVMNFVKERYRQFIETWGYPPSKAEHRVGCVAGGLSKKEFDRQWAEFEPEISGGLMPPTASHGINESHRAQEYKFVQVRLTAEDAKRFRRAAEDNGLTIQAATAKAIGLLMTAWGEGLVKDPGTELRVAK